MCAALGEEEELAEPWTPWFPRALCKGFASELTSLWASTSICESMGWLPVFQKGMFMAISGWHTSVWLLVLSKGNLPSLE